MATYTTVEKVGNLTGKTYDENTLPSAADVTNMIDLIEDEINNIVAMNYDLPIDATASPLAHGYLGTVASIGAASLVVDTINAISNSADNVSNPWSMQYRSRLERILLADVDLLEGTDAT